MARAVSGFVALVVALTLIPACSAGSVSCNRSGCDAMASPANDDGHSAVAGVVAQESDVVLNGCQECTFGSTSLAFWKTPMPISDIPSAMTVAHGSSPLVTVQADGQYAQPLDPGPYLACTTFYCASVQVEPGHVTTLHLKLIFGPTQFIVFDAQRGTQGAVATFEVD